jgi:hypothetical protein
MSFGIGMGGQSDLTNKKTFYDKMVYDELMYKQKKGAKNEVGVEIEGIIP